MVREFCAAAAVASAACIVPDTTTPGGKPVTELPGLTPRSPVIVLEPVLVTVEPPRTAKPWAEPSDGFWARAGDGPNAREASARPAGMVRDLRFI